MGMCEIESLGDAVPGGVVIRVITFVELEFFLSIAKATQPGTEAPPLSTVEMIKLISENAPTAN